MLFPLTVLSWTLRMLSLTIRPSPGAKFLRGRGGRGEPPAFRRAHEAGRGESGCVDICTEPVCARGPLRDARSGDCCCPSRT